MNLMRDWLWDKKITIKKARAILKNPLERHFLSLSATLLSRKNTPKEVFKYYLKPIDFVRNWPKIKSQMRKDNWNDPRIEYWQAIYEALKERYKKEGLSLAREPSVRKCDEFCRLIADKLKSARKGKHLTQDNLAKKLGISQQMISRIEKGNENISITTLNNIVRALGAELRLEIS